MSSTRTFMSILMLSSILLQASAFRMMKEKGRQKVAAAKTSNDAVMYFDGLYGNSNPEGDMKIERQGESVYSGKSQKYAFQEAQLHKEFLVDSSITGRESPCEQPVFVKKGTGRMCNVGLFTTSRLTCTSVPVEEVNAEVEQLKHLRPATDRGMGLEFEFVARELTNGWSWDEIDDVKNCFTSAADKVGQDVTPKFNVWNWEHDGSVSALTAEEASSIGADSSQTRGVAFEVTSPGPPNVPGGASGFDSAMKLLSVLKRVGIQAGPSQGFHMHLNVIGDAGGSKLTLRQISNVWAAYAKYQLVIDEMFSPARPGNRYAYRQYLGDCKVITSSEKCSSSTGASNPCGCNRHFFNQMHDWITNERTGSATEWCNHVHRLPGESSSSQPCSSRSRWPHQRYFQVNLIPVYKFGTIEFRAHSATYDLERLGRWMQFLVAFVERFGAGEGGASMDEYFSGSADDAYEKLRKAQRSATAADLYNELSDLVDEGTAAYYADRVWEKDDKTCHPEGEPLSETPDCASSSGGGGGDGTCPSFARRSQPDRNGDCECNRGMECWSDSWGDCPTNTRWDRTGRKFSVDCQDCQCTNSWWGLAQLASENGTERTMHVKVPREQSPGSYLEVEMPDGEIRAHKVNKTAVENGFFQFTYDPAAEADRRAKRNSEAIAAAN